MDAAPRLLIDPDIARARMPPAELYGDPCWFEAVRRSVLPRAWHLLHGVSTRGRADTCVPDSLADEPVLWTRDDDGVERLLSNVCTHRGAVIVDAPCSARTLRCPYHGRRWRLDGALAAAPGFEGAEEFPRKSDDLAAARLERFGPWRFGAVDPAADFQAWIAPVRDRLPDFDWEGLVHDADTDRDYTIDAAWCLYVDNYLEGFHVPYVHPTLARVLDPRDYRVELLEQGTLQIGIAREGEDHFEGSSVAGYYFWLFPTTMINVYPWGVSLNLVTPIGPQRTRIAYRAWVRDPSRRTVGAGAGLDAVELEDQAVVARAQRGVRSALYPGGRYAPAHEQGLHHFHRLLAAALG